MTQGFYEVQILRDTEPQSLADSVAGGLSRVQITT